MPGWLPRPLYSRHARREPISAERAIVKVVRAADGDFRPWDDVRAWADGIADALTPATVER